MNKTLDKLYRSRFWSKRLPGDVIAENHQKVAAELSAKVKEKIKFETHQYGKGQGSLKTFMKLLNLIHFIL